MQTEPPTRRVRGLKGQKSLTQNPSGHGHKKQGVETKWKTSMMTSTLYFNFIIFPSLCNCGPFL